ncbi:N-acyl homoserine lactonase family protein [Cnuibacter physcomitrellae]|uniref:N-acyl homoserine lactonase family protein n=1 Tax=Cnuibacter physcomitrellae TaxID=1619308 RepID=UPI00217579FC|nr:N-acyl homoserine lactonase family protein [Cnuibacter physcomitrellae]MCS5498306.1 N-acyl homoserine lactonase family protein [Cnuibacter physcomitrellae]
MRDDVYEVLAVRYGSRPSSTASESYNFARYREPDRPSRMDYYVFVARNRSRTVLIDCGYSAARARLHGRFAGNDLDRDAVEVLEELGVRADDVDHVVLSHMHLDHMGNVDRFPRATFTVARAEYEFWTGGYGRKEVFAQTVDRDEVDLLRRLADEGRVSLVEETGDPCPGVTVTRVGGHTPGQLMTEVTGETGRVVLISDGAHFYSEFRRDRPFWLFSDIEEVYRSFETFRELDARPGVTVVPGHDPGIMDLFPAVVDGVAVDLTGPPQTVDTREPSS